MIEPEKKGKAVRNRRADLSATLNVLIVVFTVCGIVAMLRNRESGSGLTASGFENLKYFTVLSNVFCGIVAVLAVGFYLVDYTVPAVLKLMSASAVGLTFLIIAAFLSPMNPELNLYQGGNFWFHLVVPVTAMVEFMVLKVGKRIPFRYTLLSAVMALVYGIAYLVNILVNGKGIWPDTNDWYGFLNWGYPVGILIFLFIILLNLGMAVLLRFLNRLTGGQKSEHDP